jgi:hypothetical protein
VSGLAHKMARFLREIAEEVPRHTPDTASGPRTMLAVLCGCGGPTDPGHIPGCPHAPHTRGTAPA